MSSPWIDIAISVAFVFFVFSMVVSGLNELCNWFGQVRSKQLWQALHDLTTPDAGFAKAPAGRNGPVWSRVARFLLGLANTFFRIPTGRIDHRPLLAPEGDLSGSSEFLSVLRSTAAFRSLETAIGGRSSIRHVPPPVFADALQELGLRGDGELQRVLDGLHVMSPLRRQVDDLNLLVSSNIAAFHERMSGWFDHQMNELSRRYRRDVRRVMFALGFVVAVGANLNAITVVADAQRDSDLRQALVAGATQAAAQDTATCPASTGQGAAGPLDCARDRIAQARSLRVTTFWNLDGPCRDAKPCSNWGERALDVLPAAAGKVVHHPLASIGRLIGWLLASIALSFGSSFWFDAVRRLVGYRRVPPARVV